jgi:hypothetical protein
LRFRDFTFLSNSIIDKFYFEILSVRSIDETSNFERAMVGLIQQNRQRDVVVRCSHPDMQTLSLSFRIRALTHENVGGAVGHELPAKPLATSSSGFCILTSEVFRQSTISEHGTLYHTTVLPLTPTNKTNKKERTVAKEMSQ